MSNDEHGRWLELGNNFRLASIGTVSNHFLQSQLAFIQRIENIVQQIAVYSQTEPSQYTKFIAARPNQLDLAYRMLENAKRGVNPMEGLE